MRLCASIHPEYEYTASSSPYLHGVELHEAEATRGVGGLVPDQPNVPEGNAAQSGDGSTNLESSRELQ